MSSYQHPTCASVECRGPSEHLVIPRQPHERIRCPSCNSIRDASPRVHPVLGQVCVWCDNAMDYTLDGNGLRILDGDHCAACIETGQPCEAHER